MSHGEHAAQGVSLEPAAGETAVAAGDDAAPEPPPAVAPGRLGEHHREPAVRQRSAADAGRAQAARRRARRRQAHRRARGRCARGARRAASRWCRWRAAGTCAPTRRTSPGCRASSPASRPRLSRAMLETLAIVAYRQPITRPEIDEIRGVDCGPVLKTLLERSLVRMIGKKEEVGPPDPLRHDAGVPAHLQPARSDRAADAARVPRARRGREGQGRRRCAVDGSGALPTAPAVAAGRSPLPRARSRGGGRAARRARSGQRRRDHRPPRRRPRPSRRPPTVGADDKTAG